MSQNAQKYANTEYLDFDDALRQLHHWLEVEYMCQRVHSALGYLTPAEFEEAALDLPLPPLVQA